MNEHPTALISAYADGELKGGRLKQVEEHLHTCRKCQLELAETRKLSALLQEAPRPANLTSVEQFAAQVRLRLPRATSVAHNQPERLPAWQKVLKFGWMAAPLGLIGGWAFVQAVLILSWLVAQAGLDPVFGAQSELAFMPWLDLPGMGGMMLLDGIINMLPALETSRPLVQIAYLELLTTAFAGVFLWSWLAGWWISQRQRG